MYNEHVLMFDVDSINWNYSVDTWKLSDFERLFLGIKDAAYEPKPWKGLIYLPSYLGKEFNIFLLYVYMLFLSTRSLASSWLWIDIIERVYIHQSNLDINVDDSDNQDYEDVYLHLLYNYHTHKIDNENTPILLWDSLHIDIYYTLIFCKNCVNIKINNRLIDAFFFRGIRSVFHTTVTDNFMCFAPKSFFNRLLNLKTNNNKINLKTSTITFFKKFDLILFIENICFNKQKNVILEKKIKIVSFLKPIIFNKNNRENTAMLLRKQRVYSKSKFSRSRQYCKNIVLLGLLLNIVLMFGLNSAYYAILINTGYFIYPIYFLMVCYSVFVVLKYELYNKKTYIC